MKPISPEHKRFGQRIRELREGKDITQEDLAEAVGIDRSFIGFIERGERGVSLETLIKIAKALDKEVKDLFPF